MKKLISIIMCICILLQMCTIVSFAAEYSIIELGEGSDVPSAIANRLKSVYSVSKFDNICIVDPKAESCVGVSAIVKNYQAPIFVYDINGNNTGLFDFISNNLNSNAKVFLFGTAIGLYDSLSSKGLDCVKFDGDAYETNLQLLNTYYDDPTELIVCTRDNVTFASTVDLPVLLIDGSSAMTDAQKAYLSEIGNTCKNVTVIKSTNDISQGILNYIESCGFIVSYIESTSISDCSSAFADSYFPLTKNAVVADLSQPISASALALAIGLNAPLLDINVNLDNYSITNDNLCSVYTLHRHTFEKTYSKSCLVHEATCTSPKTYKYICSCGYMDGSTYTVGNKLDHNISNGVCSICETHFFEGGSGSPSDPFLISNYEQLDSIRNFTSSCFKLVSDINLENVTSWDPINSFSGVLDGNSFAIKNIVIEGTNANLGFITYNSGTIKNLAIKNAYILQNTTNYYERMSGVICARNDSTGIISKCSATGTVYANYMGDTTDSVRSDIGGICGNNQGLVERCFNSCNIVNTNSNGNSSGICGYSSGTVKDSYNTGSIKAKTYGTICGIAGGTGKIINCYNVGLLDNTSLYRYSIGKGIVDNCFYFDCGFDSSGHSCSIEEMELASTFEDFDFEAIWQIDLNSNYKLPTLYGVSKDELNTKGRPYDPYLISSQEELQKIGNGNYECYKLIDDIVFDSSWNALNFKGILDGNKHLIKNFESNSALFNRNEGIITDLGIDNAFVSSNSDYCVGILCNVNSGIIKRCFSSGDVISVNGGAYFMNSGSDLDYIGGLVGINSGEIIDCFNTADIIYSAKPSAELSVGSGYTLKFDIYAGGICAYNTGNITNAYSIGTLSVSDDYLLTGAVTKTTHTDESVGYNSKGNVSNCYGNGETDYFGFDFEKVWEISSDEKFPYPKLVDMDVPTLITVTDISVNKGSYNDVYYTE